MQQPLEKIHSVILGFFVARHTMTTGMTVSVTSHRPNYLEEQEAHRDAEGIPEADGPTHQIPNAINVEQIRNDDQSENWRTRWKDKYQYPEIRVTDATGTEHVFDHALVNLDETDPEVDIWMVHDETASNEHAKVTYYKGYGIQSETYTDTFDKERTSYSVFIQTRDGEDVVLSPHGYRGFIVKYPTGVMRTFGDIERHSLSAQRQNEKESPQSHPYATDDGQFTITADGDTYAGIVNVTRPEPGEYILHSSHGNRIRVSDITDVEGALYTVTARHESSFGHGVTTTSIQRALGVYIEENPALSPSGEPILRAVGHPDSAAVHKTPSTYRITELQDIESVLVKTPSGNLLHSFDDLLRR